MRTSTLTFLSQVVCCAGFFVLPAAAQSALPDGPGKAQVERVCTVCHNIDTVTSHHKSREDWQGTLEDMQTRGAQGSDRDFAEILNYLSKNFGLQSASEQAGSSAQAASVASAAATPQTSAAQANSPEQAAGQPATPAPNTASREPKQNDAAAQGAAAEKVNVNNDTADKMSSVLNISHESAAAIVHYRQMHGLIKSWDDLKAIPGVDVHQLEPQKDRLEY